MLICLCFCCVHKVNYDYFFSLSTLEDCILDVSRYFAEYFHYLQTFIPFHIFQYQKTLMPIISINFTSQELGTGYPFGSDRSEKQIELAAVSLF